MGLGLFKVKKNAHGVKGLIIDLLNLVKNSIIDARIYIFFKISY